MISNFVKSVQKLRSEGSIFSREGRRTRRWFRKHTRCFAALQIPKEYITKH